MLDNEVEFHNARVRTEIGGTGRLESVYASMSVALNMPRGMLPNNASKILEIGSYLGDNSTGIGVDTKYIGIDISDEAVDHANKVFANKNVEFICMDAHKVTSLGNDFDYVYGNGILHHLDLGIFVPELSKVLKSGSKAVFLEPNVGPPWLKLFRWLTPWLRSADEHPLVEKDYEFFQKYFKLERLNFGILCPLVPLIFMNNRKVIELCQKYDGFLSKTFFGRWSWMTVIIMTSRK